MTASRIEPLIIGRGAAGQALRHALSLYPEEVAPATWLERGAELSPPDDPDSALLVVAGPHGLHTPRLLEAAERGYRFAISEKPVAIDLQQVASLADLPVATWICHGYRMLWGPQTLRQAVASGRFGEILSIEGRYWQSSATRGPGKPSWKDDPELGGRFDVLIDLATHWADLVTFVAGRLPDGGGIRRWYINAASRERDTHVHVTMELGTVTSFGSVSKTVHGAGNTLELVIIGERASASWSFAQPDVIVWGQEAAHSTENRHERSLPSRPSPFHGLGWMEGYARIVEDAVEHILRGRPVQAPTLSEHLDVLRWLLEAAARETRD